MSSTLHQYKGSLLYAHNSSLFIQMLYRIFTFSQVHYRWKGPSTDSQMFTFVPYITFCKIMQIMNYTQITIL